MDKEDFVRKYKDKITQVAYEAFSERELSKNLMAYYEKNNFAFAQIFQDVVVDNRLSQDEKNVTLINIRSFANDVFGGIKYKTQDDICNVIDSYLKSIQQKTQQPKREFHSQQINSQNANSLDSLLRLGMLKRVSDLTLFHGRAEIHDEKGKWKVDVQFNNSNSNKKNGYGNVNEVPALHLAEDKRICDFYIEYQNDLNCLAGENKKHGTVYQIETTDDTAFVIDTTFDVESLSTEQRIEFKQALAKLSMVRVSKAINIPEGQETVYREIFEKLSVRNDILISTENLSVFSNQNEMDIVVVTQIAGVINARRQLAQSPMSIIKNFYEQIPTTKDKNDVEYPLNLATVQLWLEENNIIGCKINKPLAYVPENVATFMIFDLTKINTIDELARQKQHCCKIAQIEQQL